MKEIDQGQQTDSFGSTKKDYRFSNAIENMHHGKPSHEVSVPVLEKNRRRSKKSFLDDDDDDNFSGGYQPTFNSLNKSNATGEPAKKTNLMDELFGGSKSNGNKAGSASKREKSTTQLFGGGSAIVDESINSNGGNNSTLLPRRPRQPTTTLSSRPAINAVDDMEDDLEEVLL